jgi:hypothetical protein
VAAALIDTPIGIGKTETAESMARVLVSQDRILVIRLTEFRSASLVSRDSPLISFAERNDASVTRDPTFLIFDEGDKLGDALFGKKLDEVVTLISSRTIGRENSYMLWNPIIIITTNAFASMATKYYDTMQGKPLDMVVGYIHKFKVLRRVPLSL